ncbi:MAG: DUF86 domain-containing protein [bacterium]|nr:DUF86 domain-containing protein [bacterium]
MIDDKDDFYLKSMLESISYIQSFLKGVTQKRFTTDIMINSATLKQFENLGEAAKKISDKLKEKYPYIVWGRIIGTRNILIHNYLKVDLDQIWKTAKNDLPLLKKQIAEIIKGK